MSQTFLLQPGKTALGDIAKLYRGDLPCRLPGEAREPLCGRPRLIRTSRLDQHLEVLATATDA